MFIQSMGSFGVIVEWTIRLSSTSLEPILASNDNTVVVVLVVLVDSLLRSSWVPITVSNSNNIIKIIMSIIIKIIGSITIVI